MAKYYQCADKVEADALNNQIFEDLKAAAQAQGYPVVNGEIVPKRNGIPDFGAKRTTKWGESIQDPDDNTKYLVRHPDKLPGLHKTKLDGKTKYLDDITLKISNKEVTRTAKDFELKNSVKEVLDGVTKIGR